MKILRRALKTVNREQKGQVLIVVLILLLVGGLMIPPMLNLSATNLKVHRMIESNALRLYAADSGVEDGLHWLINGKQTGWSWTWDEDSGSGTRDPYTLNNNSVDVTIEMLEEQGSNKYKITSWATGMDGSTTVLSTAWAIVWIEGDQEYTAQDPPPAGDIHVNGDCDIKGVSVSGNLTAEGNVTIRTTGDIEGSVYIEGNFEIGESGTVTGDVVCVTGNITMENSGPIDADIHFLGDDCTFTLNNSNPDAKVNGNIWADGNLTILMSNQSNIAGNIYAPDGNITIIMDNSAHIYGDGNVYAPNGNVYIELNSPQCLIEGTVYVAGEENITIVNPHGVPEPTIVYPYTVADPPFTIASCPIFPDSSVKTFTYEIT